MLSVCSEVADKKLTAVTLFKTKQKVVRHIFLHVSIFYIYKYIYELWIYLMKLQYSAMYFYIVSSFLFKYRDYFISCWGEDAL